MTRFAAPFIPLLILGCASVPTGDDAIGSAVTPTLAVPVNAGPASTDARADLSLARPSTEANAPEVGFDLAPEELANAWALRPAAPAEEPRHRSLFTIKGGYYTAQDTDALDDGYILNASWVDFFSKIFAIEAEAGYLDANGKAAGGSTDLWGIPLMVNGRLNFEVWKLDLYGGLGLGTIYYSVSTSGGRDEDGWVAAGDAFLGTGINLGESFVLGLEGKYYITDKVGALDGGLDAFALMLTFGFAR